MATTARAPTPAPRRTTAEKPAGQTAPSARAPTPPTRPSIRQAEAPAVRLGAPIPPSAAGAVPGMSGGGELLPPAIQEALETSLQVNLQSVRVHTDAHAHQLTERLSARAVTYGQHIFLGAGERATDLSLIGHEIAHVVQQQGIPTPQRLASGQSDQYEREAYQASAAVVRRDPFTVHERTSSPRVQRLGISDALDFFAREANIIPGFRMFTIILGVNPINMSRVDRSAANILRALIEFMPDGGLITQALDNHGVFDKVGAWVEQQIQALGMVGSAIKQAVTDFLDSLSWSDIFDLGGVWNRAKRIFTEPIDRIISFAKGLVSGIIQFIKDAILMPLAKLAEGTRGWDLLIAVLGRNPITGEAVAPTAEILIGGFMKLIGQDEVWQNMQRANAIGRAWAWFQGAMSALMGFVGQIPTLAVNAFKSLELVDIVLVPRAFAKVAAVFGNFIGNFISWAGGAVWNLLEIIFDVVSPGALSYIKRTGAALKSILRNPLPFVGNLVKAAKLGFQNFASNFGAHLKAGLIDWLTGSLPGVYIPKAFSLAELVKFVFSVLGLTWQNVRQKLVKVVGEPAVKAMEVGFDIVVTLVTQGPAAAWDKIKEQLANLRDMVIGGITDLVVDMVVKKAVPKIVAMFIPGAGFISAILSIYDTIMVFVNKISKIIQVVTGFIDSIVAIAAGAIGAAAKRVETTLAGLLSLAINFLAGFAGLGKVADKVMGVINKVRAPIDKALDWLINWIVTMAKKLFAKVFGKGKKDRDEARSATIKEPFSIGSAGHTLTATLKGEAVTLTMASNGDIALSLQLGSAISLIENDKEVDDKGQSIKREPSQKAAILGHLRPVKAQVDNLRTEYVQAGRPEAFDKFIKPRMAASIGQLVRLAKYKPEIISLRPLISIGRPRYIPKGWNIRKNLYDATTGRGWTTLSDSLRKAHLATLGPRLFKIWQLRDDKSNPGNYAKAQAQWTAMQTAREIPSVKEAPSFANYDHAKHFSQLKYETDHTTSLGTSWNSGEKNKGDADRKTTVLNTGNLRVITHEENQERSKDKSINPDFNRDVGPDFSSAVANSPKGSATIDGMPFDDKE
jgi:hypothetical protein